jgi:hypothetical protein
VGDGLHAFSKRAGVAGSALNSLYERLSLSFALDTPRLKEKSGGSPSTLCDPFERKYFIMKKFLTLFFLFLSISGLYAEPAKEAVSITIADDLLAKLDDESRKLVLELKAQLEKDLYKWADKWESVQAPTSVFDNAEFISLSDLVIAPDNSELNAVGGGKLSPEQLQKVKEEGLFLVPSQKYAGQNHVWKVSAFFQHGSKTINLKFTELHNFAKEQFLVQIPASFIDQTSFFATSSGRGWKRLLPGDGGMHGPSFVKGWRHLWRGLGGILGATLGGRSMKKAYDSQEVAQLLGQEFAKLNPHANLLDDPALQERYAPIVQKLAHEVSTAWQGGEQEREKARLVAALNDTGDLDVEAARRELVVKLDNKLLSLFAAKLEESKELASIHPDLAKLLVNKSKALRIISDFEWNLGYALQEERDSIAKEIQAKHSYLSQVDSWLEQRVEERFQALYQEKRFELYATLPGILEASGLENEAARVASLLEHLETMADSHDAELRNKIVPRRVLESSRIIWTPQNWEITKGDDRYYVEKDKTSQVPTSVPFWRLWLAGVRAKNYGLNMIYAVGYANAWNGPLGIRSLFGNKPFHASKTIDSATGAIIDDNEETGTLVSRWKAITEGIKNDVERASQKKSRSILSENAFMALTNLRYRWIKQPVLKGALAVGQSALTVCNVVVSAGVCAASPVLAPVASAFVWAWNAVIYDLDSPKHEGAPSLLPIPAYLVGQVAILGAGQMAASLGRAVLHLILAAGSETVGGVQWAALQAKDYVLRLALINRGLLKVPTDDTWLAKRVSGPGLSTNYYYQVKAELALIVLQLELEGAELELFAQESNRKAGQPLGNANRVLQNLFGSFVGNNELRSDIAFHQEIDKSVREVKEHVAELVRARSEVHSKISNVPDNELMKVRLERAELEKLLQGAERVVKAFYEEKLAPHFASAKSRSEFWTSRNIVENDFVALARSYLSQAFPNGGIFTPIEEVDANFRLVVSDDHHVTTVAGKVLDSAPVPSLDTAEPVIVDSNKPEAARKLPHHTWWSQSAGTYRDLGSVATQTCELAVLQGLEGHRK